MYCVILSPTKLIPRLIFKTFYRCRSTFLPVALFQNGLQERLLFFLSLKGNQTAISGEVWCILRLIELLLQSLQGPPPTPAHLNIGQYYLCHIQRPSLSGWDDAYSIKPVLKTQSSHTLNCFHPALIKDVIKRQKLHRVGVFFVETRLCLHFAKMVEITSGGPFLTKSLKTIFQLWETHRGKESWDQNMTIYKGSYY